MQNHNTPYRDSSYDKPSAIYFDLQSKMTKIEERADQVFESLEAKVQQTCEAMEKKNSSQVGWVKYFASIMMLTSVAISINTYVLVQEKADKKEVVTIREFNSIYQLQDKTYKAIFVVNPEAKVDTSNTNWIVKSIIQGTLRSSKEKVR